MNAIPDETMIERLPVPVEHEAPIMPMLFQVWLDVECGHAANPDWWWDSEPESLAQALDHAAGLRASQWIVLVLPEGQNPRPDGRWDNP